MIVKLVVVVSGRRTLAIARILSPVFSIEGFQLTIVMPAEKGKAERTGFPVQSLLTNYAHDVALGDEISTMSARMAARVPTDLFFEAP